MFKNKLLKISMVSMVLAGTGIVVANTATSCRTAEYDTRASVSMNSLADYYNFFSSKKVHKMVSPKKTKDYSMGYDKNNPLPLDNAHKFYDFWNDDNGKLKKINTEMMSEMTAGDMCVLMMVCLNYEMIVRPLILNPALFQNVDNIYVNVIKMPFIGGGDFIIDMGFTYHSDENNTHTWRFQTDSKYSFNALWLIDDTLDLEIGGTPSYIDTLYSVKAFDCTKVDQEGKVYSGSENIWKVDEDGISIPEDTLQMYGLTNAVKLIFPSYSFPVYDVVV